jgi:flagellar protein FliL
MSKEVQPEPAPNAASPPTSAVASAEKPSPKEAPPKGTNKYFLPAIIAVMTVVGGLAGTMVVGPMVVAARAKPPVSEGLDPDAEPKPEGAEGEPTAAGEEGPMFRIDNLIVNPAGSQGTRFLMVSIAVATPDAKVEALLRAREPAVRDAVISLLEKQTMQRLAEPGFRDSLKVSLADTISVIAGSASRLAVFLPQFVIQ